MAINAMDLAVAAVKFEKEADASVYSGKFSVSSVTFEHLKLQKGHFVLGSLLLKGLFGCYLCVENYSL